MDAFTACLDFTLRQEGGYSHDPNDPGGATNYGITLGTLRSYTGNADLGVAAIQTLSMDTVQAIYGADYWNRMRCDALLAGVDLMVFDHGVNAGTGRSAMILQQAIGLVGAEVDGSIGPQTLAAAAQMAPATLINDLAARQRTYYQSLGNFQRYGDGWLARVGRRQTTAITMAASTATAAA
jgi:lysozyme family protein